MPMYRGKIERAKTDAEEFIGYCNEALSRLDKENGPGYRREAKAPSLVDVSYGSAETGALRRWSMNLTRTLAELRK